MQRSAVRSSERIREPAESAHARPTMPDARADGEFGNTLGVERLARDPQVVCLRRLATHEASVPKGCNEVVDPRRPCSQGPRTG